MLMCNQVVLVVSKGDQGDVNLIKVVLIMSKVVLIMSKVVLIVSKGDQGDVNLITVGVNCEQGDINCEQGGVNCEQGGVDCEQGGVNVVINLQGCVLYCMSFLCPFCTISTLDLHLQYL